MKKGTKLILALLLSVMGVASISGNSDDIHETPVVVNAGLTQGLEGDPINTDSHAQSYYSGISSSLTGDELLRALRSLNAKERTFTPGYGNSSSGHWKYFNQTDYHPDNKNKYVAYYRGTATDKSAMNKEHVWPDSRGGNLVEDDIHVIRPTISADNSSRGNAFYVEGGKNQSGWDPYAVGMTERYRGDAARIIFYAVVANSSLSLIDETNDKSSNNTMGKLSDLLKWNLEYPVDQTEINRNNGAEDIQGNRNPFIDDRSLACKIWGDTNDSTRAVCRDSMTVIDPTSINITPDNPTVNVGATVTLSVTATPSNASKTVNWSSSNTQVAIVNNGVVTGLKEGTAKITATYTKDSSIKDEITVTVKSIKSITLSGKPTKTTYVEGETFNPSGLSVTATFNDNSTQTISTSSCTWLDGNTNKTTLSKGTTSVIAKCGSATAKYEGIIVNENPKVQGYKLANSVSDLKAGDNIILAYNTGNIVAGDLSGKILSSQSATFSSDKKQITEYSKALIFKLGGSSGKWEFLKDSTPLGATGDKSLEFGSGTTTWDITISSGKADIASTNSSYGKLQYNTSAPRFVNYKSASQQPLNIYYASSSVTPTPTPGGDPTTNTPTTNQPTNPNTTVVVPPTVVLTELSVIGEPNKSTYIEGEAFDPSGMMVCAKFNDGSTMDVTSEVVWNPKTFSVGDDSVTGSFTANGVTKTITIEGITVISSSGRGCSRSSSAILNLIAIISVLGIIVLKKKY